MRTVFVGLIVSVACAGAAFGALEDGSIAATKREPLRTQSLAPEVSEGVERDPVQATKLYCVSARLGVSRSHGAEQNVRCCTADLLAPT